MLAKEMAVQYRAPTVGTFAYRIGRTTEEQFKRAAGLLITCSFMVCSFMALPL